MVCQLAFNNFTFRSISREFENEQLFKIHYYKKLKKLFAKH
jgi:hypothetical protein